MVKCICGRDLKQKKENLTRLYKGKDFVIYNVPVYSCEKDHYRLTIGTRRKILLLLKDAFENEKYEVDYIA